MSEAKEQEGMVLQKWLIWMGVGSKQEVRTWITRGEVCVNGEVVRRFAEPLRAEDEVTLRGEVVKERAPRTVLLMNKPKKHLTMIQDPGGSPALGQYLPEGAPHVFPVGRLDFNTEGALLWTNDGALARRILHPDWSITKTYHVKLRDRFEPEDPRLEKMRNPMDLGDFVTKPAEVRWLLHRTRATWVEIVIREGKFRQVRRMCAAAGFQIVKLRRVAIGPVLLGEDLNPRCVRSLREEEIASLDAAVGLAQ